MMFELPGWAWLGLVWLMLSVCLAAGLARWFRCLREREWHG